VQKKQKTPQQLALYMEKTIQQTTEDVRYTKNSKSPETRTIASTSHVNVNEGPLGSKIPDKNEQHLKGEKTKGKPPSNNTSSRSYSPATLFSSFLEHFQTLITPLINLLTTLINTILTKNVN